MHLDSAEKDTQANMIGKHTCSPTGFVENTNPVGINQKYTKKLQYML